MNACAQIHAYIAYKLLEFNFACAAISCEGSDVKIVDVAVILYALPISCLKIRKKDIKTVKYYRKE